MAAWIVETIFYAVIAIGATWASWRTEMAAVGLMLVIATTVSTITFFTYSLPTRLVVEVVLELAIAHYATMSLMIRPSWPARIVMTLAAADAVFVGSLSYVLWGNPNAQLGHEFGTVSNALFAVMCCCVAFPGVRDAYVARLGSRLSSRRVDHSHLNRDWVERQIEGIERGKRGG